MRRLAARSIIFVVTEILLFVLSGILTLLGFLPDVAVARLIGPDWTEWLEQGGPGLPTPEGLRWTVLLVGLAGIAFAALRLARRTSRLPGPAPSLAEIAARVESRRLEGRAPLLVEFPEEPEVPPWNSPYRALTMFLVPGGPMGEDPVSKQLCRFAVRNVGSATAEGLEAYATRFVDEYGFEEEARVRLPQVGEPGGRLNLAPGDVAHFRLLESLETGLVSLSMQPVTPEELETWRLRATDPLCRGARGGAWVPELDASDGHPLYRDVSHTVDVALYARNQPATLARFSLAPERLSRVRLEAQGLSLPARGSSRPSPSGTAPGTRPRSRRG